MSLFGALFLAFVSGCASVGHKSVTEQEPSPSVTQAGNASTQFDSQNSTDIERLSLLWKKRVKDSTGGDYPIGPGDLIEISVPGMEELKSQAVRVSGDGNISLPLVGKMQISGLSEEELKAKLRERLEKFMYNPYIGIFVKERRNQQVAVLGSVGRPGVYTLKGESDTILDLLSQAGGITGGADPRIQLIPAEPADKDGVKAVAAILPNFSSDKDPPPLILKKTDPIMIDLRELAYGGYQDYLSLPVRPGDVIMVPGGGQILVDGWVERPGAYSVTPGLTVSGVVASAGGASFAADTSAIKIIRSEKGGKKRFMFADLEKIKNGQGPDIPLQGGDLVEVSYTSNKLVPYAMYRMFTEMVHIAVGGTIPVFR